MTQIKVLDLNGSCNFGIHDFFNWNHLVLQNIACTCQVLKFKIWIVQTFANDKMTKIQVLYLDDSGNFGIQDFFI